MTVTKLSPSPMSQRLSEPVHQRRRGWRMAWVWGVSGALLLLAAIGVWVGVRGFFAYQIIAEIRSELPAVAAQLSDDPSDVEAALANLAGETQQAAQLVSDPVWKMVEVVPWLGPNLEAFRVTASSLDTVVREVGVPLAAPLVQLEGALKPVAGRIDPAPLQALEPLVADAKADLDRADAAMASIDTAALIGPLRVAVAEFQTQMLRVSEGVGAVHGATVFAPALLGAEGTRDTLLLFLNNAELRSTGGIPGALALVRTDGGSIELAQQASTRDFPKSEVPVMQLSPELRGIYGDRPAQWIQNVTYVPEFPLTGELAVTMWEARFGVRPQAVIALDPFVLAELLRATGPVVLATGETLSGDTAVEFLLHDVYFEYPQPEVQDAVFADAAARVFDAVTSGGYDTVDLLRAVVSGAAENRLKVWSSLPEEQALFAGSMLAGELPGVSDDQARFAMMLNDGTGSKMDYFLKSEIELLPGFCAPIPSDGSVKIRVTLANMAPLDAATRLPEYITGGGRFSDVPVGEIRTIAQVFAPPGFELHGMSVDGSTDIEGGSGRAFGRSLATWSPVLGPGQSGVLELEYRAPEHVGAEVAWQQTPTLLDNERASGLENCE